MWQLFFEMSEITGASSSQNCLIVLLLLFERGGLYIQCINNYYFFAEWFPTDFYE